MIHGQWNRSGRPGNRRTNVCYKVPKMPTDAISEVLNFKKNPELQIKLVAICRMHPLKLIKYARDL